MPDAGPVWYLFHEVQQEGLILAKSTHDLTLLLGHLRQLNLVSGRVRVTWYPNSHLYSSAHTGLGLDLDLLGIKRSA